MDRIDIQVEVPALEFDELRRTEPAELSSVIRGRVEADRSRQRTRGVEANTQLEGAALRRACALDAAGEALMRQAYDAMALSARSYDRILRVARTIADLDGAERIEAAHLAEAIQYRTTDYLKQ